MKKGFTFAELMISLVIISVISAILYPTIADLAPNENAALFRSAYRSMSIALSEVMNDTSDGVVPHNETNALCLRLAEKLNVRTNNCNTSATFITSNGMRWYVSDTCTPDGAGGCTNVAIAPVIIIDVAASNNDTPVANYNATNLSYDITIEGVSTDIHNHTLNFANAFQNNGITGGRSGDGKTQDTFVFAFNENGRMTGMDNAGYSHIKGETYKENAIPNNTAYDTNTDTQ